MTCPVLWSIAIPPGHRNCKFLPSGAFCRQAARLRERPTAPSTTGLPDSTRRAFLGADASIGLQVLRTRREANGLAHWRGEGGPQPQPQPNMQMMMRGAARARRAFAAYGLDPIAVHGEDLQPMLVVRHDDVLSMRIRLPRTVSPSHLKHRPVVHQTPMAPPDCACAPQGCRAHRTPCGTEACGARQRCFGPSFAANEQPTATV
jgi:hypothetical protein